jgi:hypothetical protein
MNRKIIITGICTLVIMLSSVIWAAFTLAQKKSVEFKDITFKVIPDKDS